MASQVYYAGDFYYANEACAAGDGPGAAPSQWTKVALPVDLEQAVALYAAAGLLANAKQMDAAAMASSYARTQLNARMAEAASRANNPQPLNVPYRG